MASLLSTADQRKQSILDDTLGLINIESNATANAKYGKWYSFDSFGNSEIKKHSELIDRISNEQGVDSKLVRAIMFTEASHGKLYGSPAEFFGAADSLFPMNIRPDLWKNLLPPDKQDLTKPENNIEAGVILLKRINDRLDPSIKDFNRVQAIGTLYNSLAKDKVSDYGAAVAAKFFDLTYVYTLPLGPNSNLFQLINKTYLIGGALQNSGNAISDGVNPVFNGTVQSGGGWSITTDASLLNNNQYINGALDNTSTTAWTQILGDGIRHGDMNTSSFVIDQKLLNQYNQYLFNPSAFDLKASSFNLLDRRAQLATPTDPLILDLNADGVKLTDWLSDPVLFDADNDGGSKEQTGWVDKNDGIVVYDLNNNGVIDNISETLSEYFNGTKGTGGNAGTKPFKDGFAALKSLDSNSDNQFTSADTAWNSVKVWVDLNHDGESWNDLNNNGILDGTEATELKTFAQLGITAINLKTTQQSGLINGGNEVLSTSTFIQNGLIRDAQAANFITNPNGQTQSQSGAGVLVTFEGSNNIPTSKSYLSQSTTGEVIDLATKGVINATGGTGNDTLHGTSENNWLAGSQGSDTFNAGAGDDVLLIDAEDLAANIHGGDGMDIVQVVGDAGVTLNLAQAEIEIAQGGRGNDIFVGNGGKSVFMRGGDGDDVLIGGAANDALNGEDGSDYISGSLGNDVLRGGRGQDALFGDAGDDLLFGGQDDDALNGSGGNDVLRGDQGDDILDGGDGIDVAELTGLYSDYRITKLTDTTWRVVDTQGGRDGADTLVNVEKLNFADVSSVDITLPNPLPVKDVVTVANRTGSTINYNGTTYQYLRQQKC